MLPADTLSPALTYREKYLPTESVSDMLVCYPLRVRSTSGDLRHVFFQRWILDLEREGGARYTKPENLLILACFLLDFGDHQNTMWLNCTLKILPSEYTRCTLSMQNGGLSRWMDSIKEQYKSQRMHSTDYIGWLRQERNTGNN